jgi:4-oxalocrotonate tautomerase
MALPEVRRHARAHFFDYVVRSLFFCQYWLTPRLMRVRSGDRPSWWTANSPPGITDVPENDSVTAEEKAALIKGVSELLLDVLNKPLESTYVLINEVELEDWGWGGLPTEQYRRQRSRDRT